MSEINYTKPLPTIDVRIVLEQGIVGINITRKGSAAIWPSMWSEARIAVSAMLAAIGYRLGNEAGPSTQGYYGAPFVWYVIHQERPWDAL